MFALPGQRGRGGQLFCTITLHRSGLATRFLVTDLFFRPLFAFFLIELKSRKVIHVGVTRSPSDCTGYLAHPFLKTRRGQRFERARIYNFLHASAEQAQSTFLTSAVLATWHIRSEKA